MALAIFAKFQPISQSFARFKSYLDMFPSSEQLRGAVETFCHHVVDFLGYSVNVLQARKFPFRSILRSRIRGKVPIVTRAC
jgi:hypothetical protein